MKDYLEPQYPIGEKNGPYVRYSDYQTEVDYLRSIIKDMQSALLDAMVEMNQKQGLYDDIKDKESV